MLLTLQSYGVSTFCLALLLAIALVYDIKLHRIPNWLTASGLLAGITLHYYFQDITGLVTSLAGAFAGLVLLLPFYIKQAMGAGDVKLMAAIGAILGLPLSLYAVCASLIAGGVIGVAYYAFLGGFRGFLPRFSQMAKVLGSTGRFIYIAPTNANIGKKKFPYSTAIGAGTLAVMYQSDQLNAETWRMLSQLAGELAS